MNSEEEENPYQKLFPQIDRIDYDSQSNITEFTIPSVPDGFTTSFSEGSFLRNVPKEELISTLSTQDTAVM